MTPEQEERFDRFYEREGYCMGLQSAEKKIWKACLEANGIGEIPEGYFKIGDKVEYKDADHNSIWKDKVFKGIIIVLGEKGGTERDPNAIEVRRIPAWKPKDGEAVLVGVDGKASVGYIENGTVYADKWRGKASIAAMKPFDASKIGKPWSEI